MTCRAANSAAATIGLTNAATASDMFAKREARLSRRATPDSPSYRIPVSTPNNTIDAGGSGSGTNSSSRRRARSSCSTTTSTSPPTHTISFRAASRRVGLCLISVIAERRPARSGCRNAICKAVQTAYASRACATRNMIRISIGSPPDNHWRTSSTQEHIGRVEPGRYACSGSRALHTLCGATALSPVDRIRRKGIGDGPRDHQLGLMTGLCLPSPLPIDEAHFSPRWTGRLSCLPHQGAQLLAARLVILAQQRGDNLALDRLPAVGLPLVEAAGGDGAPPHVQQWAAHLDVARYSIHSDGDRRVLKLDLPESVTQAMESAHHRSANVVELFRLLHRYRSRHEPPYRPALAVLPTDAERVDDYHVARRLETELAADFESRNRLLRSLSVG